MKKGILLFLMFFVFVLGMAGRGFATNASVPDDLWGDLDTVCGLLEKAEYEEESYPGIYNFSFPGGELRMIVASGVIQSTEIRLKGRYPIEISTDKDGFVLFQFTRLCGLYVMGLQTIRGSEMSGFQKNLVIKLATELHDLYNKGVEKINFF